MPEGSELTNISALVNFKGKLCAVAYSGSHGELWVLDDTQKEKWSKHSFVSPNTDFEGVRLTWATDTGEIAWVISRWENPFYVFFYNLDSKSVRRVEITGIDDKVLKGIDRKKTHYDGDGYHVLSNTFAQQQQTPKPLSAQQSSHSPGPNVLRSIQANRRETQHHQQENRKHGLTTMKSLLSRETETTKLDIDERIKITDSSHDHDKSSSSSNSCSGHSCTLDDKSHEIPYFTIDAIIYEKKEKHSQLFKRLRE
ncbi:hypothetical protein Bca101_101062 [Brassica carinata]